MYVPGHIAFSYLSITPSSLSARQNELVLWLLWFGSLLPDLIDKPIKILGFTPYGRTIGHSLIVTISFLLLTKALQIYRSRYAFSASWIMIGFVSHMIADLYNDVGQGFSQSGYIFNSWFLWPWKTPDDFDIKVFDGGVSCSHCLSGSEWITIIFGMYIAYKIQYRTFFPRPEVGKYSWIGDVFSRPKKITTKKNNKTP